jgi:hypothetical protein
MKPSALATFVAAALATTTAVAQWDHDQNAAAVASDVEGIHVGVLFAEQSYCNSAALMLLGVADIEALVIGVDDNEAYKAERKHFSIDDPGAVGFFMNKELLAEIKHGNTLTIITEQGWFQATLQGSAKALNEAYSGCLAMLEPPMPELKPRYGQPKIETSPWEPAGLNSRELGL